ncbi:MAG: hypothetical protein NTZ55_04065 [Candidatus Roizmanbacteria bacterium]|nr:hypothetical protein [Candidatus Roizmanbacteria bacterium]
MAEKLSITPSGPDSTGEYFYNATLGPKDAMLSYRVENGYYRFEYVFSHIHKGASRLINRFCEDVGPGNRVTGVITNYETKAKLKQLGYVQRVNEKQADIPVDESDAQSLKMYEVLVTGGLQDVQFYLQYDGNSPEFECHNCIFTAFT